MVVREDPTDVWVVVEADDGLAFELGQHARHFLVLLYAKGYPISFCLPVRCSMNVLAKRRCAAESDSSKQPRRGSGGRAKSPSESVQGAGRFT